MAVYYRVYNKVICRLTVWRLGWALIMLHKQQSCLPLSVSSNNAVAITGTGCTDPLRDGQAELASVEMCDTMVQLDLFLQKINRLDRFIHMTCLSL